MTGGSSRVKAVRVEQLAVDEIVIIVGFLQTKGEQSASAFPSKLDGLLIKLIELIGFVQDFLQSRSFDRNDLNDVSLP